jgi:hypothetical protein
VGGFPDELVEFGDGFADLRPKLIVAAIVRRAAAKGLLDPLKRAFGAVESSGKVSVIHGSVRYAVSRFPASVDG